STGCDLRVSHVWPCRRTSASSHAPGLRCCGAVVSPRSTWDSRGHAGGLHGLEVVDAPREGQVLMPLPLVQRPEAPGRQGRHYLDGVRQPSPRPLLSPAHGGSRGGVSSVALPPGPRGCDERWSRLLALW